MKRLLLLIPVIVIIGCGLFGGEDYWPLKVDNLWTYAGTQISSYGGVSDTTNINLEVKIVEKTTIGGEDAFKQVSKDSTTHDTTVFVGYDTIYVKDTKDAILTYETTTAAPETALMLPLEQDKTWKQVTAGGDTITYTVKLKEDVTVPAKTYKNCWKIEALENTLGFPIYYWYADGTGMVKMTYDWTFMGATITYLLELTEATIK